MLGESKREMTKETKDALVAAENAARKEIEDENEILQEEAKQLAHKLNVARQSLESNKLKLEQLANLYKVYI